MSTMDKALTVQGLRFSALDLAVIMRRARPDDLRDRGPWQTAVVRLANRMGMDVNQRRAFYRLCGEE